MPRVQAARGATASDVASNDGFADRLNRLVAYHADRDPVRAALKFARMREGPFAFLRGTNLLFQESWGAHATMHALHAAPLGWQCGDMHAENFGSFRGGNRLVYFDLNDFDDACLAPAPSDVARLATSVAVAAQMHGVRADAPELVALVIGAYASALRSGKPWWMERATATGIVRDLLRGLKGRSDLAFYESRCKLGRKPRLRIDGVRTLEAPAPERERITRLLRTGLVDHAPELVVHDVARRIAGAGSLGVPRWVALVEHALASEQWALVDLKLPWPVATSWHARPQPMWRSDADRVVSVQRLMQAAPPAMLRVLADADGALVVRELMPSEDRVRLREAFRRPRSIRRLLQDMGELLAWAQLRAAGRLGAAGGDDLVAWATAGGWETHVEEFARAHAERVHGDWTAFVDVTSRIDLTSGFQGPSHNI